MTGMRYGSPIRLTYLFSALMTVFLLTACAGDNEEAEAEETPTRANAASVLLSETIPEGAASGALSAVTEQRFRLSGKSDFLIESGSRLEGRYELAYQPDEQRWRLSIDWHSLDAKGVSRIRNLGRRPPFYTQEGIVAPAGISPELPEGLALPMRLFNLRDRNVDFERIILVEE